MWRKTRKTSKKTTKTKKIKFFVIVLLSNVIKFFTSDFSFFMNFELWFRHSRRQQNDKTTFLKKRNCTNEFIIISNIKLFFILIYNRMRITINTFTKEIMKLLNVNYVSNFMINIVANNISSIKNFISIQRVKILIWLQN